MRNQFSDQEIFDNIFLGAGGYPLDNLVRLLKPCNPLKNNHDLVKELSFEDCVFGVRAVFELIKVYIRQYGALVIERFKMYPEFVADNNQLIFDGDWNDKEQFSTGDMPVVHHALLVVGASLTDSGSLKLLVQTSFKHKPFVTLGYDLLRSMGVNRLLAVQPGLSFFTDGNNVDHAACMTQGGSPISQEFSWGLNKPAETSVSEEDGATRTMPSYWDLSPKNIAFIF
jgi:hypothetical protein